MNRGFFLSLVLLVGCHSAGTSIHTVTATSPAEQLRKLEGLATTFGTLTSTARVAVRAGERQTRFPATLSVDRSGSFLLVALTPIHSSAVTLFLSSDGEVLLIDHLRSLYWAGRREHLRSSSPLYALLGRLRFETISRLLFGLPASNDAESCVGDDVAAAATSCFADGYARYLMTPAGISRIVTTDKVELLFDGPSFPPGRVSLHSTEGTLEVEHLETLNRRGSLSRPPIDRGYRRVSSPAELTD